MKRLMDANSSKPGMTQQISAIPDVRERTRGLNTRKTRRGHNQAQVEDRRQKTKQVGGGVWRQPGHGFFSLQPLPCSVWSEQQRFRITGAALLSNNRLFQSCSDSLPSPWCKFDADLARRPQTGGPAPVHC